MSEAYVPNQETEDARSRAWFAQAIHVYFIGPTNTKDARWKAICEAGTITLAQDSALEPSQNAMRAALALLARLGWDDRVVGGVLPKGGGYVFVQDHGLAAIQ